MSNRKVLSKHLPRAWVLFTSTSTIVVLLFVSEHRHKMSTRTSTVYKYVKEHCPIPKEHRGAREHYVETP
jgi:molybdopterin synthase catalytic subunit